MKLSHPFTEDLQSVLDSEKAYEFLPDGTWTAGGCGLLATALTRLIPEAELVLAGRITDNIADHLLIRFEIDSEWVYLDYGGVQSEADVLENAALETSGSHASLITFNEAVARGIETDHLFWLDHSINGFTKFLSDQLGPIDTGRLSPDWFSEEEDQCPGLN